ncbi:hypothetical protein ACJRO7_023290 [Eucalyptus globulus]|uniref:Retrotransposon Copia-like N-terminal domain-containing protein n=1 Tax=Eucalyptus globulus TaxID=34317 RepID=A0ABD3K6F5_EUCGL
MSDESSTTQSNPPSLLTKSTEPHPIQITSIKLNRDNFFRWSQSVRMYIRGRGKIGYLTGDNAEPATDDPTWAVWDAENSAVMTWLTNSMEEDIGTNYLGYYTAKELWDAVCEMYSDLGNQSQIYELTLKLGTMRQGEETVTKYFHSLKRLWQELDVFNDHEWTCIEDGNRYRKIVEAERIYAFLAGLRDEFDEVRGRILEKQPLPPIGEVFSEVRREESRRGIMLGKSATGGKDGSLKGSALTIFEDKKGHVPTTIVSEANVSKIPINLRRSDGKPRIWCDFCNKPRHTRETCWRIHGRPASTTSEARRPTSFSRDNKSSQRMPITANEATAFSFNKEQLNHLLQLLQAGSVSGNPTASIAHQGSYLGEDDWQC